MLTVNIFDHTCQHHLKDYGYWMSTDKRIPKTINFLQKQYEFDGITLFTDDYILSPEVDRVNSKLKVAWCLESPAVKPHVHNNLELVEDKFDYIFTYRNDLIEKKPTKYKPNSPGGTWLTDHDIFREEEKTKLCSMILSGKKDLEGHKLRHKIQDSIIGVDYFGWGSRSGVNISNKADAMKSYMFHITIENTRHYHYFSEKLVDCLLMKCIPIYWGCLNINDYFNTEGFYIINEFNDLKELVQQLKNPKEVYGNRRDIIEENFELAKKHISSDDYFASKLIKLQDGLK